MSQNEDDKELFNKVEDAMKNLPVYIVYQTEIEEEGDEEDNICSFNSNNAINPIYLNEVS